jgi:hypothetical protein
LTVWMTAVRQLAGSQQGPATKSLVLRCNITTGGKEK